MCVSPAIEIPHILQKRDPSGGSFPHCPQFICRLQPLGSHDGGYTSHRTPSTGTTAHHGPSHAKLCVHITQECQSLASQYDLPLPVVVALGRSIGWMCRAACRRIRQPVLTRSPLETGIVAQGAGV